MPKAMTSKDWAARVVAYTEAAAYLDGWEPTRRSEVEQGKIVARLLKRDARKCQAIAESTKNQEDENERSQEKRSSGTPAPGDHEAR